MPSRDPTIRVTAVGQDEFGLWEAVDIAGVPHRFRWIPPGVFLMGSPDDEPGRWTDEGPQHTVLITRGFWLGETPVTQAQWQAVMGDNPSRFKSPERPVETVSWQDAQSFCEQLSSLYARLPSEAEWEYACRAGTSSAMWRGRLEILGQRNAPGLDEIAWYGGNSGVGFELEQGADSSGWPEKQYDHKIAGTREVATRAPNPWGLYDMLGNVHEWCLDANSQLEGSYSEPMRTDPVVTSGSLRVFRGGSWFNVARRVRAAFRYAYHPSVRDDYLGFRLARGPAPGGGAGAAGGPGGGAPSRMRGEGAAQAEPARAPRRSRGGR
ncbi:MAG: formylglycine-generating enzyme family protein [Alphaproteobacteria bacterium]|nr:formylglycine-generating enzyme family protein [Alphaproteobacteria bacterium]